LSCKAPVFALTSGSLEESTLILWRLKLTYTFGIYEDLFRSSQRNERAYITKAGLLILHRETVAVKLRFKGNLQMHCGGRNKGVLRLTLWLHTLSTCLWSSETVLVTLA